MRRTIGRGFVGRMSLENEPNELPEGDAAIVGADTESTALLELAEPESELVGDVEATEEASEAATSLEAFADFVETTLSSGGMSRETAHAVNLHVEHISTRSGLANRFPALESFGGSTSRVHASRLALEGINDKLKEIWAAIVAALKKAAQWVVDNFNKYFGAAEKLQKRAEAITTKAEGLSGKKKKEQKLTSESLFKSLQTTGKADNVAKTIAEVSGVVEATFTTVSGEYMKTTETVIKALEDGKGDVSSVAIKKGSATPGLDAYGAAPEGMGFYRSDELPGGMALVQVVPVADLSGVPALEAYGRQETSIRPFNPKASDRLGDTLPVLDAAAIITIAKAVDGIGGAIVAGRKLQKQLGDELKKATSAAEKFSSNVAKDNDSSKELKESARAIQRATSNMARILVGGPVSVVSYASRTASAALNYCEKSISQYE